jgi:hypothetical protein
VSTAARVGAHRPDFAGGWRATVCSSPSVRQPGEQLVGPAKRWPTLDAQWSVVYVGHRTCCFVFPQAAKRIDLLRLADRWMRKR